MVRSRRSGGTSASSTRGDAPPRSSPSLLAQEDELVPAEPPEGVARADAALQPAGDLRERAITRLVAERVVDPLEAVEVEEEEPDRPPRALEAGERVRDAVEQAPVGEAGQGIVARWASSSSLALDGEADGAADRLGRDLALTM